MENFYNPSPTHQTLTVPYAYMPSNEQAAWFAIAYTAASIEGDIHEDAREALCKLIASKDLYKGHEILDYFYEVMEIKEDIPAKEIIGAAAKMINPEQAPTLFCLVTETLLAKGYLTEKEEYLLNYISKKLALDQDLTSQIIEVLLIKNKGNRVYNSTF